MGSKKKSGLGKKKKKKTKTTEGRFIGAALMPAAAFAAVPRLHSMPTPTLLRRPSWGLSSALLNSTILTRMLGTPSPSLGRPLSDSDTSVVEYVSPREATRRQKCRSTGGSADFSSYGMPAPPHGFGDYDSETDFTRTPSPDPPAYMRKSIEAEINPIYSTSLRSGQHLSQSPSPSTLRRSGTLTETGSLPRFSTLTETGTLPKYGSLRSSSGSPGASGGLAGSTGSGGSRRRPPRRTPSASSIEERIEAQMVEKQQSQKSSLQSSLEKSLTRVSTDLSHTGSFRLNTLREQNAALVEKQSLLEKQLLSQKQLQEQLMSKLKEQGLLTSQNLDQQDGGDSTQDVGSLLQETQSVTDQTLEKQDEVVVTLKDRVTLQEKEKKELEEINEQLRMEIISLHRMASARDEGDSTVQTSVVSRLKDERDTLQAMTIKLNAELSRYQAKFRPLSQNELDTLPGLPSTGPKPSWLVNTKYLAPLFVAYDDQLQDREAAVQDMQAELETICRDVEDVVRENQRLHVRLNQSGAGGTVGMTEWQTLQQQCKLVLEENQLLMEQLDVQQIKVKDMHKGHIQEVSKLSKRLVVAEAERNQLEQEVADIRDKMAEIKKEHTKAVIENKSKLDTETHVTGLSNLKQILEEEKTKHAHELDNTMTKLQNLATERKSLSLQVEELRSENQTMEAEMKVMQKSQKKSQKKIKLLQQSLEESAVKEQTAERYLSSIIKVAEKTVKERDSFVEKAEVEHRQKKAAVTKVMEGNLAKNKMEEKLKLMKSKASEKLEKAASRMKEQDNDFSQQRLEYEREIKHLRLLLRERQEILDVTTGEKRRVEDDLETMWQVATADNQRMRDTLHKSLRKLQEHGSLRTEAAGDDGELPLCDSDIEK